MTYYFKFVILIILILIFSFLGITLWTSNTTGVDEKVFHLYEGSKIGMALAFTEELEKNSSSAKYPLYQAYILREKHDIEQSTTALKRALKPGKTGKSPKILSEIHLNLTLNAYLNHDLLLFKESLKALRQIKQSNKNLKAVSQYIDLFRGIEAYLNKDYKKALPLFQKHQTFTYLSPWMKNCFKKQFSKNWIDKHIVRCLIEDSKFSLAHQKLDEMASRVLNEEIEVVYLLKALSYFKEASCKSVDNQQFLHKSALFEISKINNKSLVANDLRDINLKLQTELLQFAREESWQSFSLYINSLNELSSKAEIEAITSSLIAEIEFHLTLEKNIEAFTLLQKIQGPLRVKLLYNIHCLMKKSIENGDLKLLQAYINLMKPLDETKEFEIDRLKSQIAEFCFSCLNHHSKKSELGISAIVIWQDLEKNPESRLIFAKRLVQKANLTWLVHENYDLALELFKIALMIPPTEKQSFILEQLEENISIIYRKAQSIDAVEQYFYILKAVKSLKLNTVNIYDEQEKKQQLDDAKLFYLKGHDNLAYKKASFVLELEPENENANRIVGMIAIKRGNQTEALHHLKMVKHPDSSVLEALKSQDLTRSQPKPK